MIGIGLFACVATAGAQTVAQNYVRSRTMLNEAGTACIDNIVYHDGLGRPYLTVQKGASPDGKNLVTLQEYDGAGRESATWLPVALADGYPTAAAIQSAAKSAYGDNLPYAKTMYEASPLNRVSQQYGPGAAWHNGHPVRTERLTNSTALPLSCLDYRVDTSSGALTENGNYAAGELYVQKTTDEDGNVAYTFTDKQGQLLLERRMDGSTTHDTYYVYDIYGNLCYVLQPMYQSEKSLEKYAFRYEYDHRNRCVRKTVPGAQYVEYVYDDADRLTYSQDGNQRAKNRWTYYSYDKFGRLTGQGECTGKVSTQDREMHVSNSYDNYNFVGRTAGFSGPLFTEDTSTHGKGKLTGRIVSGLNGGPELYAAYYYDDKGREIKSVQGNIQGGYDVITTTYSFSGMPLTVTHNHTNSGTVSLTEVYTYTYDHANRLTKVEHTLDGVKVTLASYTYDSFGRLQSKSLHGSATNKLEYMYNLRGWLTGITGNEFIQLLSYETSLGTPAYNGNISTMLWITEGKAPIRGYNFYYDGLDRLTAADYHDDATLNDHFSEKVTGYDKNGNILSLQRYGQTGASAYGLIDNLTFTMDGNRPTRIDDGATGCLQWRL